MEADPIKRSLEEIDRELEVAMSHLSDTNQRVDDLLNEYVSGELTVPRAESESSDDSEVPASDDDE